MSFNGRLPKYNFYDSPYEKGAWLSLYRDPLLTRALEDKGILATSMGSLDAIMEHYFYHLLMVGEAFDDGQIGAQLELWRPDGREEHPLVQTTHTFYRYQFDRAELVEVEGKPTRWDWSAFARSERGGKTPRIAWVDKDGLILDEGLRIKLLKLFRSAMLSDIKERFDLEYK